MHLCKLEILVKIKSKFISKFDVFSSRKLQLKLRHVLKCSPKNESSVFTRLSFLCDMKYI